MTQVWIYIVRSSADPDAVDCVVPWRVDKGLIFFGPCKTRIRERLRKQFLTEGCRRRKITDDLIIVGVNGSNAERIRKIIWAGKLSEVMTFAEADRRLSGDRFRTLREHEKSPLHLRPVLRRGNLVGYDHVSDEHIDDDAWISDLVSGSAQDDIHVNGRRLLLRRGTPWQVFDRDCCMLLENLFFAQGEGIEFDNEALTILGNAQPESQALTVTRSSEGRPTGKPSVYEAPTCDLRASWQTASERGL